MPLSLSINTFHDRIKSLSRLFVRISCCVCSKSILCEYCLPKNVRDSASAFASLCLCAEKSRWRRRMAGDGTTNNEIAKGRSYDCVDGGAPQGNVCNNDEGDRGASTRPGERHSRVGGILECDPPGNRNSTRHRATLINDVLCRYGAATNSGVMSFVKVCQVKCCDPLDPLPIPLSLKFALFTLCFLYFCFWCFDASKNRFSVSVRLASLTASPAHRHSTNRSNETSFSHGPFYLFLILLSSRPRFKRGNLDDAEL